MKDFFHLAGLQHLVDIALPRNRSKTIQNVLERKITDELLEKSKFHLSKTNDEKCIKDRIEELQYLEEYLDVNNTIKIFSLKDTPFLYSEIDAEYVIESSIKRRNRTVYIFLKERKEEQGTYCVVSFFVKNRRIYGGEKLYWMLKRKYVGDEMNVLYQHPNYIEVYEDGKEQS